MLTLPASVRVFVARGATDLRRSFDRLSAQVQEVLRQDPFSGHVFVFINRQREQTTFNIPIEVRRDRIPLAPVAWEAGATVPAHRTLR